ncbi:hypothetical protein NFI96_021441 [Prochilodus magdalenae]|nr:hypothetical protein NFI96_021441 [Prochilodus magdalenae]
MANHLRFVARTVMVQDGNIDAAYRALNRSFREEYEMKCTYSNLVDEFLNTLLTERVLSTDGIIETVKRGRYYEKPCRRRQRENYENCKRIYNMDMARKISFISRANRQDPWLGC